MEGFPIPLAVILVLLLRLGVPVLVTVLIVYGMRRLDARWQEQAARQEGTVLIGASQTPCWEVRGCLPEQRIHCSGFLHPETPCWQQFRTRDGRVRAQCQDCSVFRDAPAPALAPVK